MHALAGLGRALYDSQEKDVRAAKMQHLHSGDRPVGNEEEAENHQPD